MLLEWIRSVEQNVGKKLNVPESALECKSDTEQRKLLHHRLVAIGALPVRSHPDLLQGPLTTFAAAVRMHYNPEVTYLGETNLILAQKSALGFNYDQRELDRIVEMWLAWAPKLRVMIIPGNHMTILKSPYVQSISRLLAGYER
jgi:thioesterase domain-containing protein